MEFILLAIFQAIVTGTIAWIFGKEPVKALKRISTSFIAMTIIFILLACALEQRSATTPESVVAIGDDYIQTMTSYLSDKAELILLSDLSGMFVGAVAGFFASFRGKVRLGV